jgi:hypothetical protein
MSQKLRAEEGEEPKKFPKEFALLSTGLIWGVVYRDPITGERVTAPPKDFGFSVTAFNIGMLTGFAKSGVRQLKHSRDKFLVWYEERKGQMICDTSYVEDNKFATCHLIEPPESSNVEPKITCIGDKEIARQLVNEENRRRMLERQLSHFLELYEPLAYALENKEERTLILKDFATIRENIVH